MDVLIQLFLEENIVRFIEQERRYVLNQGVKMEQEYKVTDVKHTEVESDVLNQDVQIAVLIRQINVQYMVVESVV
jgi:hypothetical protein